MCSINRIEVFILIVLVCKSAGDYDDINDAGQIKANMNEYMDLVMEDAGPWIVNNGLDPLRLFDITKQFQYKPVFVVYQGHMHLSNGILNNLRNISRSGNSVMYYGHKLMRIDTEVSMTDLNFRYDYDVAVMNMGPRGWIDGSIKNINLHADFIVDLLDFQIYIQDFRLTHLGSLDFKVHGHILIDWLPNIIIKVVNRLFRSTVVKYVSTKVHEMAQITVDRINNQMSIYDRREVAAKFLNDIEIKTMLKC